MLCTPRVKRALCNVTVRARVCAIQPHLELVSRLANNQPHAMRQVRAHDFLPCTKCVEAGAVSSRTFQICAQNVRARMLLSFHSPRMHGVWNQLGVPLHGDDTHQQARSRSGTVPRTQMRVHAGVLPSHYDPPHNAPPPSALMRAFPPLYKPARGDASVQPDHRTRYRQPSPDVISRVSQPALQARVHACLQNAMRHAGCLGAYPCDARVHAYPAT